MVFQFKIENFKKRNLFITKNACTECFFPNNTKPTTIVYYQTQ